MSNRNENYQEEYSRFSLDIERGDEEDVVVNHSVQNRVRPGSRATSSRASSGLRSSRYQNNNLNFNVNTHVQHQGNANGGIQIIKDGFDDEDVSDFFWC